MRSLSALRRQSDAEKIADSLVEQEQMHIVTLAS